jgi:hypothetical protein
VVVTDSSHYAVSDKSGRFFIPNVPAGRYVVNVWHERGKLESITDFPRQVTISHESTSLPPIRLIDAGQLMVPHKNKYGHDYETPSSPLPAYK